MLNAAAFNEPFKEALKGGLVNDERVRRESRLFKAEGVDFMVMRASHKLLSCPQKLGSWEMCIVHSGIRTSSTPLKRN